MSQEPPRRPSADEPEQHKPGPHEKLHSLYPLTFEQAVERALQYKPAKEKTQPRPRDRKPKK
jgi:hypothetical protein